MMKTILCFGDSNTWGFKPDTLNVEVMSGTRLSRNERWPGVLQVLLGKEYLVVEDGQNGRTTRHDQPADGLGNGLRELPSVLKSHHPLDLVIIALGLNDTKTVFNQSAVEIAEGVRQCVGLIKKSNYGRDGSPPQILVIAPQPIRKEANNPFNATFDETFISKSEALPTLYQQLTKEEDTEFLDAGLYIKASMDDALHFDATAHQLLAEAVAEKVKSVMN